MKFIQLLLPLCMLLTFFSCKRDPNSLYVINSESFHEKQVQIHFPFASTVNDSLIVNDTVEMQQSILKELEDMFTLLEQIRQSGDNNLWAELKMKWEEFNANYIGTGRTPSSGADYMSDTLRGKLSQQGSVKWAELNAELLKLSGEVRFGDALEILLYGTTEFSFPEKLLKSVMYTHVYDDIYINIIGSSSMEYHHTTGGTVKLIQETNYPKGNDMILKIETGDIRYVDFFIRIPTWAVNPSVSYGNIKYVALPGEYCEVSKKWRSGDEIRVSLKN